MLEPGLSHEKTITVTDDVAIHFLGPEVTPGLSTPATIMQLEMTAHDAVQPHLAPGQNTVGVVVNVAHLAATPVGMKVTFRATLTKVEDRRLTFSVEAHDEKEKIAEGTHQRFIIDVARFAARLKAKAGR